MRASLIILVAVVAVAASQSQGSVPDAPVPEYQVYGSPASYEPKIRNKRGLLLLKKKLLLGAGLGALKVGALKVGALKAGVVGLALAKSKPTYKYSIAAPAYSSYSSYGHGGSYGGSYGWY